MPKRLFKKITPHPETIKQHKSLRIIQHLLHDPNIWHFNRRSVPKAFMIGVFCAFLPIPLQMLLAALCSLNWRANLPLAVILVWITNPVTMGPIFFASYKLGAFILKTPEFSVNFDWSIKVIFDQLAVIWRPLWLGSLILGAIAGILSYYLSRFLWIAIVVSKLKAKNPGHRA